MPRKKYVNASIDQHEYDAVIAVSEKLNLSINETFKYAISLLTRTEKPELKKDMAFKWLMVERKKRNYLLYTVSNIRFSLLRHITSDWYSSHEINKMVVKDHLDHLDNAFALLPEDIQHILKHQYNSINKFIDISHAEWQVKNFMKNKDDTKKLPFGN